MKITSRRGGLYSGAVLGALALTAAACSSSPASSTGGSSSAHNSGTSSATGSRSGATVGVANNSTYGKILVNSSGRTLYTYGPDAGHGGQATCTGGCLQAWPALTVPAGTNPTGGTGVTGTLAAVKQSDGTYQVTYNGLPLYTFVQDTSAGKVTGNDVTDFTVATASTGASSSTSPGSGGGSGTTSTSSSNSSGGNGY